MIDPHNITNFNRSQAELEELLLFCTAVPGHNAKTTSVALSKFLAGIENSGETPFDFVRFWAPKPPKRLENEGFLAFGVRFALDWRRLMGRLDAVGIGCKTRVARSWIESAHSGLNLKTCSVEDLEKIYGIGPKTARFFVLHSSQNPSPIAVLDVHVLRWLASKGHRIPKSTPASKREYLKIEKIFTEYVRKSGKTLAEFDLEIWRAGANKKPSVKS